MSRYDDNVKPSIRGMGKKYADMSTTRKIKQVMRIEDINEMMNLKNPFGMVNAVVKTKDKSTARQMIVAVAIK